MRILLTRPSSQGEHTAALLRARGHAVLLAPLLRIEAIEDAELGEGPWTAVVMTSANAAHAISAHRHRAALLDLPAFVVGARTAAALRAAGFTRVESADGDVTALADLVAARIPRGKSVLYLAGEDRAGDLGATLLAAGLHARTVVVYRAIAEKRLPQMVMAAVTSDAIDAMLHFSKRSAETFLTAATAGSCLVNVLKYKHFCLSAQVAAPLLQAHAKRVVVAARPDEAALLDLVGDA